jgi:hypothetical protein
VAAAFAILGHVYDGARVREQGFTYYGIGVR